MIATAQGNGHSHTSWKYGKEEESKMDIIGQQSWAQVHGQEKSDDLSQSQEWNGQDPQASRSNPALMDPSGLGIGLPPLNRDSVTVSQDAARVQEVHRRAATNIHQRSVTSSSTASYDSDLTQGTKDTDHAEDQEPVTGMAGRLETTDETGQKQRLVGKLSPDKLFDLTLSPTTFKRQPSASESPESIHLPQFEDAFMPVRENAGVPNHDIHENGHVNASGRDSAPLVSPMTPIGGFRSDKRPGSATRALSTPLLRRTQSSSKSSTDSPIYGSQSKSRLAPAIPELDAAKTVHGAQGKETVHLPQELSLPMPPFSIPAFLQLEVSSHGPSPMYIHRPFNSDFPYEPSHVKIERLLDFFMLPPHLELVLWFGALACFDAWLYNFTILPLRFIKALHVLVRFWALSLASETRFVVTYIYTGIGRVWKRRVPVQISHKDPTTPARAPKEQLSESASVSEKDSTLEQRQDLTHPRIERVRRQSHPLPHHRRSRSLPSLLTPSDKADLMKGFLITISCVLLMYFDASQMYHSIRRQAAIKLYVIYNVLEVSAPPQNQVRKMLILFRSVIDCCPLWDRTFSSVSSPRKHSNETRMAEANCCDLCAFFSWLWHTILSTRLRCSTKSSP